MSREDDSSGKLFVVTYVVAIVFAGLILALTGCAWSDDQVKENVTALGWLGQAFGPQGVVASGAITAVMIAGVKLYRAWKGDPALTAMAAGTAAAIEQSKLGATPERVAAILSESIPGAKTAVVPEKVDEILRESVKA